MQKTELLIFDADCAFCQKCVDWGRKNLKYFPEAKGFQHLKPADYGLVSADVQNSIWLIRPDDSKLSANLAASAILKQQPNYLWRLLGNLADTYWIAPFAKRFYYLVAKNRHKLPGATTECELPRDTK